MIASPKMPGARAELPESGGERGAAPRAFWAVFGICALVALCALWVPKYLPLVDLPQHAAQVAIWKHLNDPAFGFRDVFELQFFTPYLLGYGLARLFAEPFSILVAMKLVLTLTVLAWPLALWSLLKATAGDRWWSLAGFPLAFGFAFLWGFFSYIVAIPLGIFYLAFVVDYVDRFSLRRAIGLGALSALLLATHLIVFVLCGVSAGALIVFSTRRLADALRRSSPLLLSALLALVWASRFQKGDVTMPTITRYGLERLAQAPALLLGYPGDETSFLVGLLLMLLFVVSGIERTSRPVRWIPLGIWLVAYLAVPQNFQHVSFIYPRLAVWLVPCAILATQHGSPRVNPWLIRGVLSSIALGWLCFSYRQFAAFDRDARPFDVVSGKMEPNRRVRSLIFERSGDYTPGGSPFLHFPAWYQVEKGGTLSYSFAHTLLSVAVFRPEKRRVVDAAIDWFPESFDIGREQEHYDYFVVASRTDRGPELFRGATRKIELLSHAGIWWLYRRTERPLP